MTVLRPAASPTTVAEARFYCYRDLIAALKAGREMSIVGEEIQVYWIRPAACRLSSVIPMGCRYSRRTHRFERTRVRRAIWWCKGSCRAFEHRGTRALRCSSLLRVVWIYYPQEWRQRTMGIPPWSSDERREREIAGPRGR